MKNNLKIKHWGFYLANIPYWDAGSKSFLHKTRPVLIYNFSGGDAICLPITSNENKNGTKKREENDFEVSVKLEKYSLIKVSKPLTIDKKSLFKFFGIQANTKTRRQVRQKFKNKVLLREI